MFQERAQETPSDAFSSTHHAAREITAPLRRRGILVDENLNLKALRPLADRGIPLTHVREVGLCGHPDEEVFDHAISHQQLIATMDKDFSSFTRFDQSNSYGVLILPAPKKNDKHLYVIAAALDHFANYLWDFIASEKGIVIRYGIQGSYRILKPYPDNPKLPMPCKEERYDALALA